MPTRSLFKSNVDCFHNGHGIQFFSSVRSIVFHRVSLSCLLQYCISSLAYSESSLKQPSPEKNTQQTHERKQKMSLTKWKKIFKKIERNKYCILYNLKKCIQRKIAVVLQTQTRGPSLPREPTANNGPTIVYDNKTTRNFICFYSHNIPSKHGPMIQYNKGENTPTECKVSNMWQFPFKSILWYFELYVSFIPCTRSLESQKASSLTKACFKYCRGLCYFWLFRSFVYGCQIVIQDQFFSRESLLKLNSNKRRI